MNIKNTLSAEDLQRWGKELISYFFIPVLIVFLTTLQLQGGLEAAIGAAYGTGLACSISLLGKYKSGLDTEDFKPGTKTIIQTVATKNPEKVIEVK